MIKRLFATWYFVRAGDYLASGDYALALDAMKKVRVYAGAAYNKTSLFEMNMRMALAAKMCGQIEIAIDEIEQAKIKISKVKSINEYERQYLTVFCDILKLECVKSFCRPQLELSTIRELLHNDRVARRFKNNYPIEV